MSIATPPVAVRPSIASAEPEVTPEELVRINGRLREGIFELVDGKLVRKPVSATASLAAGKVILRLGMYLLDRPIGHVFTEQEYQCFPTRPKHIRIPDVSFVLSHRMPSPWPDGYLRFVPDLAVEVVSPTDLVYSLDDKLEEYRSVGFPLVWTINPDGRLVRVHRPGQPIVELRDGDVLTADPLLPGFAVPVADLMLATTAAGTSPAR